MKKRIDILSQGNSLNSHVTNQNNSHNRELDEYLIEEYKNIAEAHFRTIEAISSFFRYYLIIMALPITLFSAIVGLSSKEAQITYPLSLLLFLFSLIIAFIGFFVFLYIVNLRMDVILYARTVNSIRKFFYDTSKIEIETKLMTRTLPQTASLPRYFETWYFFPVVASFALFNSLYFFLGSIMLVIPLKNFLQLISWDDIQKLLLNQGIQITIIISTIFFFIHFFSYWRYANYREHQYLKTYAMGIDIDGVLNKHRQHFCELLSKNSGKQIDPERITIIPVHEDPNLGISKEDEELVFNDPLYWSNMPCIENAANNINKLRNTFRLKIHIFTHRPWPNEKIDSKVRKQWIDTASKMLQSCLARKLISKRCNQQDIISMERQVEWSILNPIEVITKCWLCHNNINYDKLTIEKASEDIIQPKVQYENRFYISRKKSLRFFVEDNLEKARKLAFIVDVVFLMNQPYNQDKSLPRNVLRVESWDDVYHWIRKL